jgi:hypothetical protein
MSRMMKAVPLVVFCALIITVPSVWAYWVQDGVALCTAPGEQFYPTITSNGAGGAIITWPDGRSGSKHDLYAQMVNAWGAPHWTANGVALCTATGDQWYPQIISDAAGGAIVTWTNIIVSDRDYDIRAQRVDASGGVKWTANGVSLCRLGGLRSWPMLIPDGAGGAIIVWDDARSLGNSYDIYAQRVDASGAAKWTANGVAICTRAGYQAFPYIASDGAGGAIVTWWDSRNGNSDIYAQRVDASGAIQWAANGVALCTEAGEQDDPQIISDAAGGAIVMWWDSGNMNVYAQRVDASGAVQWATNGIPLCTTGSAFLPTPPYEPPCLITSDGAGGAIVTWVDHRNGTDDIYAQRVNASGAVQWTADGVALCSAAGTEKYPEIASDEAGGAIVTWMDSRNGDFDMYAQRVDSLGAVQWTADGVALCIAPGDQDKPSITSDGRGGAIITWGDYRAGNWDIYSQRIGPDGAMHTIYVDPPYTLINCAMEPTVAFRIDQIGMAQNIRGYEVTFSINSSFVTVADPGADIVEGSHLSSIGTTMFSAKDNGGGSYTVTCAILGGATGATGDGELFTVKLTPVATGMSDIDVASIKLRDLDNGELTVIGEDGSIQVDCTPPTMEAIVEAQNAWYNAAPVFSNFGFDDDLNLDFAEYKIDGGSWTTIFSGIDAATWDSDGWTLPGFDGLSQGTHTVYFRVKDDAGNWNGEGAPQPALYIWSFRKDTVVPSPPTGFVAMPGHDKTHLTWTNPTGDPTFDKVEIRFNPWSGYPHYLAPAPSYPGDHTQGTFVALVAAAAYDDNPRVPRDVYYYAAFSRDSAGNYSVLGSNAIDRTTSYWLGDIMPNPAFDGLIDLSDFGAFVSTFGVSEGGGGWIADCDFGPTDDWSRLGIPLPDNKVDFEDLMIFAMNYHKVTPLGLGAFVAARVVESLTDLVRFEIVAVDENTISIVMKNGAAALKGVRLVVEVSGADLAKVSRGSLFAGQGDLFFGTVPATAGTADICVAALGVDTPLRASGEIARLAVNRTGDSPASVKIKAVDLRNMDNERTEIVSGDEYETPFVPTTTALMQNFPNPFNPTTTLTFDVAQSGNVTIQIYDVSGRLVATVLNAWKAIGRHQVEWNGKDASGSSMPSGIYFYRMKTAGYEATRKMILLR